MSPTRPLVHVLIPTHGHARYIEQTLRSICEQTYSNWICSIYVDGIDPLYEPIMNCYHGPRFRWAVAQRNGGRAKARNELVAIGKDSSLCTWIDSDDIMLATRLERQVGHMLSHPEIDFLATEMIYLHLDGRMEPGGGGAPQYEVLTYESLNVLNAYNPISNPTVMWRQGAFDKYLLRYRTDLLGEAISPVKNLAMAQWLESVKYEDLGLWRQLYKAGGRVHCLPERLTIYRLGTHS